MAKERPEYFYHPAVGVVSPASLDLFRLKASPVPPTFAPDRASASPSPVNASVIPEIKSRPIPTRLEIRPDIQPQPRPEIRTELPAETRAQIQTAQPNVMDVPALIPAPRKPMTLSRTAVCAVTGQTLPQHDMIRFVISPDNGVVPDLLGKLPGTALFIKADRSTLQKALWRNTFTSVARDSVTVPDDLIVSIEKGLSKLCLETINLGRRAGDVTLGFAKIEEKLQAKTKGIYIVASDASDHGRTKLVRMAPGLPVLDLWTSDELSAALGEANTNHILLGFGGLSDKLSHLANKLKAVRSDK